VNDYGGLQFSYEPQDRFTIANIDGVMLVPVNFGGESPEDPTCVAFRAKENRTLIVVNTGDSESESVEVDADLRTD
jgi:hypothetical protein